MMKIISGISLADLESKLNAEKILKVHALDGFNAVCEVLVLDAAPKNFIHVSRQYSDGKMSVVQLEKTEGVDDSEKVIKEDYYDRKGQKISKEVFGEEVALDEAEASAEVKK